MAGRPPEEDEIEPLSRAIYERAQSLSSVAFLGATAQLQALARGLVAFFAEYDLLLTPALAERPLEIGECNGVGENPMEDLARSGRFTPFTSLYNVTGQPAISVPLGFGDDGCRPPRSSSRSRWGRTHCSRWPRRWSPRSAARHRCRTSSQPVRVIQSGQWPM